MNVTYLQIGVDPQKAMMLRSEDERMGTISVNVNDLYCLIEVVCKAFTCDLM